MKHRDGHRRNLFGWLLIAAGVAVLCWHDEARLEVLPPSEAPSLRMPAPRTERCAVESPPTEKPGVSLRSVALRGELSGERSDAVVVTVTSQAAPVEGADIVWLDESAVACLQARRSGQQAAGSEPRSIADRIRLAGQRVRTDARGEVRLPVRGSYLALHVAKAGLTATRILTDVRPGQRVHVALAPGGKLRLRAIDDAGHPFGGMPIVAVWRAATSDGADEALLLGYTDEDGRLEFDGWTTTAREAHRRLDSSIPTTLVGPAAVGLGKPWFTPVGLQAPDQEVAVRVPPVQLIRCSLATATGHPALLSGAVTSLACEGSVVGSRAVLRDGASEHYVAKGKPLTWRVASGGLVYGAGAMPAAADADGAYWLHCDQIISVTGSFGRGAEAAAVSFRGSRGPRRVALRADDGPFRFALPICESIQSISFEFARGPVVIAVPEAPAAVWDVGRVEPSVRAFGRMQVAHDGEPFAGEISWGAWVDRKRIDVEVERAGGEYVLHAATAADAVRLVGVTPGFADIVTTLRRGSTESANLIPEVDASIATVLPVGETFANIRVRLFGRWHEPTRHWQPLSRWATVDGKEHVGSTTFQSVAMGRYRFEVWSIEPPCRLAQVEVDIDGLDPSPVHVTGVRSLVVDVDAGIDGYWVVPASSLARGRTMTARQLPSGRRRWTVPAEEREVWLCSPGRVPHRLSIVGAQARASLACAENSDLVAGKQARRLRLAHEGLPIAVHAFSVAGGEVRYRHIAVHDWASGFALPCDYVVSSSEVEAAARWQGNGWRIVRDDER